MRTRIPKDKKIAIGIDFGNTNCHVGIYYDKYFECLSDEIGNISIPSYIHINQHNEKIIGYPAKQQAIRNPQNTLHNLKKLIGKTFQQLSQSQDLEVKIEPQEEKTLFVFQNTFKYDLEGVLAMFFAKLKSIAEQFLEKNQPIIDVTITIPVSFGESERLLIKAAAKVAGFKGNIRLINEPVAAILAYNNSSAKKTQENVFVFDLGGSHLGLSIFAVEEGISEPVITTEYDLSGRDFDYKIIEYCLDDLKKNHHIDIKNNSKAMKRLENHCEKAKKDLTFSIQTQIEIDNLYEGEDYVCKITKPKFEDLSSDLCHQIISHIDETLQQSGLKIQQLSQVILAGGATKILKVTEIVCDYFKGIKIQNKIDPEQVGVYGAAVQAAIICGHHDLTPPWFCSFPLPMNDLPLGIELAGGLFHVFLERNTVFPHKKKYTFATSKENQTSILVNLFEGFRPIAKENHFIGSVSLDNIPPAPQGVVKIEVTIDIDPNDILKLIVMEVSTGRSNEFSTSFEKMKWQKEDLERCIKDAETRANEYREMREKMEALSLLESCCYYLRNKEEDVESGQDVEKISYKEVIDWIKENPNASKEDYQKKLEMVEKEVLRNYVNVSDEMGDLKKINLPRGLPSFD